MGIITGIEKQKRQKNRYSIYIDNEYAFSLYDNILLKYGLKVGLKVDVEWLKKLIIEDDMNRAYNLSLNYLGYRSRSKKEIMIYLQGKGSNDKVIDSVIEKLYTYGFIDDMKFALSWVQNRMKGKPMGRRLIEHELRNKGIEEDIIQKASNTITSDDEHKQASILAAKYYEKYSDNDERKRIGKVAQALRRRGFEWETINKAMKTFDMERK